MSSHDDWVRFVSIPVAAVAVAGQVQAAQYLTVQQAQKLMFGKSATFQRNDLVLDSKAMRAIREASGVRVERSKQPLWEVREGDQLNGYFIVDEVYGKHEYITYAVALGPDGRVRQIEILVYRESYGYEIRNPAWRAQFIGKKHGDPVTLDEDIKNISGATMSCRHISEGVKRLLATYEEMLHPG
ncbi:MAG: FMN-binding protein [Betaproteobacteria bacterium]|jgi:Na+-translocating ferredoxin:NAD+ oxidoreductase RnfG subunit|nr:MAG: FMN-binding protein [Betaproteobacteria bacterium]